MGEIADMMLEGVLCQICGVYLGEGDGYPMTCPGCSDEPQHGGPAGKKRKRRRRRKRKQPTASHNEA